MAGRWASAAVLKAVFKLCFIAFFFQMLAFAEWIFASTLSPQSPIAHMVHLFFLLLAAEVVSVVLYFRMPWVAVVVAWLSAALILIRAVPWGTPAWLSVLNQFRFELVFLILAHVGLAAYVMMNRAEAREIEEATAVTAGSGEGAPQP